MKAMMALRLLALASVLTSIITPALAQDLPSERPTNCNRDTCENCTPYMPKTSKAEDFPCDADDFYFPVPVRVVKNDTSINQEEEAVQWACYACCSVKCGYNDLGSDCRYRSYEYNANNPESNVYGCSKCAKEDEIQQEGGTVKLSFENMSTKLVYSVRNQAFQTCAPAPPPTEVPATAPSVEDTNVPTLDPTSTSEADTSSPSPTPIFETTTPPPVFPEPTATTVVAVSPEPATNAPEIEMPTSEPSNPEESEENVEAQTPSPVPVVVETSESNLSGDSPDGDGSSSVSIVSQFSALLISIAAMIGTAFVV